jgi:hypothetical protein
MTTVQNTAADPGGEPLALQNVRIVLMTGSTSTPGYLGSSDIIGSYTVATDQTGHWSANLTPNSEIIPENTWYQVTEAGGAISPIVVPASGGPYNLSQLLVTPPGAGTPLGITGVQVAADGTVAGVRPEINLVAGTNVTLAAADNPSADRVDVTINATGGGGGGTPSDTVEAADTFGIAPDAGTSPDYSRGDHQHGTPAAPTAASVGADPAGSAATAQANAETFATNAVAVETARAEAAEATKLTAADNLSDLTDNAAARGHLGLGSAATQDTSAFDAAGAASTAQANAISTAESNAASTYVPLSTLPLPIASGGTGHGTQAAALTALAGTQTAGRYLRSDGTNTALAAIQAADVPTLNQSTTGTAAGLSATLAIGSGGTGQATAQAAINALTGAQSAGKFLRSDGTNATLAAIQTGDVPTLNQNTSGTAAGLSSTLAVGSGGTGQTSTQAALDALAGGVTSGSYLRGNGTHVALSAIQAGDVPTLNQSTTGTAANVTGTVAIANGGTGQTGQQAALNALTGTQTAGRYLRSDGTNATLSAIQAGDVPTLNQSTSGTAAGLSATLAVTSGGTGQTSRQAAINALTGAQSAGAYLRSDGTNATLATIQAADIPTLNQNTTGTAAGLSTTLAVASGGTGATTAIGARASLGEYAWDTPAARGLLEYNFPPQMATVSNNLVSGSIYGTTIIAQGNSAVSRVGVGVLSSAATPTSGQNLIGLYSISGTTATQIAVTGDLGTWSSQGFQSYAFGAGQTLVAGNSYIILLMSNATTPVHVAGLSTTAGFPPMYNAGLSNTAAPWLKTFLYGTAQTALPGSFTISGTTMASLNAQTPWACLL